MRTDRTLRFAFYEAVQDLHSAETSMGEMAAVLSDLADALTYNPASLMTLGKSDGSAPAVSREEWPSYQAVMDLLTQWAAHQKRAQEIWDQLGDDVRATLPPPCTGDYAADSRAAD